ncbi:MAG: ANTAR domain-containing protein [Streptosporangiales bacterium]|nr:ANTAR domain-containing protein [Streptosporangiales bacterium]
MWRARWWHAGCGLPRSPTPLETHDCRRRVHREVAVAREQQLAGAFVELADTLVAGFDVIDFLYLLTQRCVQLLDIDAAGLLLADGRGRLELMAASTEQARLLELFQLQNEEGPCLDCYRTREPVACDDLGAAGARWPRFAEAAQAAGYMAVQALPMRLRGEIIGATNLFRVAPGHLDGEALHLGQALADVATIGILHERALRERELLAEQLQAALNSRVLIEQAKGVLAERRQLGMDEAFTTLRSYARNHNRQLSDVARAVTENSPDVAELTNPLRPLQRADTD